MLVTVNGTSLEVPDDSTVAAVVALVGVLPDERGVAVAVDRVVVPRAEWSGAAVEAGARLEVLRAAAGG